jgi:hypothetical protein
MRAIKTTAGTPIELDDDMIDVIGVIDAVSRDLLRRKELDYTFEDVDREFKHLVEQLSHDELCDYLKESLVLTFRRYMNERLNEVVSRANRATDDE